MTDRTCIATKGVSCPHLSAIDLISCCADCGEGCNGGVPIWAWKYWKRSGISSGGAVNTTVGCRSYPYVSCEYHEIGSVRNCPNRPYETPRCYHRCDKDWDKSYKESLHFGKTYYYLQHSVEQIQLEILKNGPVAAEMTVYTDFYNYKSHVYRHVAGKEEGHHAVKIIGWGVEEDGCKYWLVVNSWGIHWGEYGLFKILRGENECGIEDDVSAGEPRIY